MLLDAGALHERLTLPFEFAVAVKFVTALKYAAAVGAVGGATVVDGEVTRTVVGGNVEGTVTAF